MINPNGKGSCPSGFTRSTNYCTKKVGDDKGAKKGASGQSASASSSVNNAPDPERAIGGKPVLKRLAKRNELDYCPTGYHSSHANRGECVTPWAEAPNVSMRKGACAAGTTEERGQFCTGSTSLALNLMDAAYVADFNTLYMLRKQKGLDTGRDRARKRSNRTCCDIGTEWEGCPFPHRSGGCHRWRHQGFVLPLNKAAQGPGLSAC